MATNRTMSPAVPTATAQTDDAARGGLFANPDLSNVVTGVEIAGASVASDSSITINFIENGGATQIVTFSLNQAANGNFDVTFPDSAPVTAAGNPVVSGSVVGNNLILRKLDGTDVPAIDLSQFDFAADIMAVNTRIDNLPTGATMTSELTDWPTGLPGQFLEINASGDLEFAVPQAVRGASIIAGNQATAFTAGTIPELTGLAIDPASGFRLRRLTNQAGAELGTYVFERTPAGPTIRQPSGSSPTPPLPAGVFDTPLALTLPYSVDQGTFNYIIENDAAITATGIRTPTTPGSMPTSFPVTANRVSNTELNVMIADTESGEEGSYVVTTRVDLVDPANPGVTVDTIDFNPVPFRRFVPFYTSGVDLTFSNLPPNLGTDVVESGDAWNGIVLPPANRPSGVVFWAVLASELPSTINLAEIQRSSGVSAGFDTLVTFIRDITLTTVENETFTYNIFRGSVRDGFRLANFTTR